MMTQRYDVHAGFVTTPRYFDDSPQQFLQVAPERTGVLQRVMHIPDYGFELDERSRNFELLKEGAVCLGEAHCQVIGQVGSNWVHCCGTTPEDIVAICDDISSAAGARFFMAGHCIVDALHAIGAKTITIANGYFRDDWAAGINGYLEAAGFEILWSGDIIAQGIVADHDEKLRIEAETLWDYPDDIMISAAVDAHRRADSADAIVQTGAGFRMVQVADTIEQETGKTLVASDFALYWAMLRQLGLRARPGHGRLLETLG